MYLKLEGSLITEAWHQVRGCMLCRAAASILCERVESLPKQVASKICMIQMQQWIEIPVTPGRLACLALPLQAFHRILETAPLEI
jgi:NifU-like protein involved in Fe-S cluster formation